MLTFTLSGRGSQSHTIPWCHVAGIQSKTPLSLRGSWESGPQLSVFSPVSMVQPHTLRLREGLRLWGQVVWVWISAPVTCGLSSLTQVIYLFICKMSKNNSIYFMRLLGRQNESMYIECLERMTYTISSYHHHHHLIIITLTQALRSSVCSIVKWT